MFDTPKPVEKAAPPARPLPTYDAVSLTQNCGQAQIVLEGQTYTLRITRAGKLLLTK